MTDFADFPRPGENYPYGGLSDQPMSKIASTSARVAFTRANIIINSYFLRLQQIG